MIENDKVEKAILANGEKHLATVQSDFINTDAENNYTKIAVARIRKYTGGQNI